MAALALGLALAGDPARSEPSPDDECGVSAHEAVSAAEKALASKATGAQAAALACLVQAVKLLEASQPLAMRGAGYELLHVPKHTGGPGKP